MKERLRNTPIPEETPELNYRIKKKILRLWDGDRTIYRVQKKGWLGWYYIGKPYTTSEAAAKNQIKEHINRRQARKTEIIPAI